MKLGSPNNYRGLIGDVIEIDTTVANGKLELRKTNKEDDIHGYIFKTRRQSGGMFDQVQ
jgi:hypothetical protein